MIEEFSRESGFPRLKLSVLDFYLETVSFNQVADLLNAAIKPVLLMRIVRRE